MGTPSCTAPPPISLSNFSSLLLSIFLGLTETENVLTCVGGGLFLCGGAATFLAVTSKVWAGLCGFGALAGGGFLVAMSKTESNMALISFLASSKSADVAETPVLLVVVFGELGLPGILTVTALAGFGGPFGPVGGGGGGGGGALGPDALGPDAVIPNSRRRSSACFSKSSLIVARFYSCFYH